MIMCFQWPLRDTNLETGSSESVQRLPHPRRPKSVTSPMKTTNTSSSNILRQLFVIAFAAFASAASYSLLAQSELPPAPPGSYFTTEGYLVPEGAGGFQPDVSGPPFPGTNTSGTNYDCTNCPTLPDYGKGFYLTITLGTESGSYVVSLENTTNGLP